jgi:hypothetical protein
MAKMPSRRAADERKQRVRRRYPACKAVEFRWQSFPLGAVKMQIFAYKAESTISVLLLDAYMQRIYNEEIL